MAEGQPALRYRAFISYSHTDEKIVGRLHRQLESYRLPRGLGTDGNPAHSGRIRPVFRDRDELAGGGQLSDAIEAALDQSAALIVACSPAAAKSHWVNQEIRRFRRRHPDRPVLAFVVAGDPAANPRELPEHAAFPLTLLLSDPDDAHSTLLEPLAADARAQGDGFHGALLKLLAGLLGVGLDRLRQRDLHRRKRLWTLATAASLLLTTAFAVLAWQAMRSRDVARDAQARAEVELTSERQTRDFLLSVFDLADAGKSRGNQITVREVLDRAVARIDHTPFDRPAIKARFLATLGQVYASLDITPRAIELLHSSLASLPRGEQSMEGRRQRIDSRLLLADVLFNSGAYDAAKQELEVALASDDRVITSPEFQSRADVIRGDLLSYLERDTESEIAYRKALALVDRVRLNREDDARIRARAWSGLALLAQYAGEYKVADSDYAKAVSYLIPVFGESHPDTLATIISRASNAYFAGDSETARREWQHSLAIAEHLYDPLSPEIGTLKNNLGRLALETDDLNSAEAMLNDAIASDRKYRTAGFDDLAYPLNSMATLKLAQHQPAEARKLLDEALSIAEAANHPILGPVLTHLADLDCHEAPTANALAQAERSVSVSSERDGEDSWHTAEARLTVAYCKARLGKTDIDRKQAQNDLEAIRKHFAHANVFTRRAQARFTAIRDTLARSR